MFSIIFWLNTVVTSTKRHGVTWMARIFQHWNFKSFKKTITPKFILCIGFIPLSSDWWSQSFFLGSNIQKDKKSKWSTYYVTPWRKGFSINIILKTFFDSAKNFTAGAPNPLLLLQTFKCRLSMKKHPGQSKKLIFVTPWRFQ